MEQEDNTNAQRQPQGMRWTDFVSRIAVTLSAPVDLGRILG